MERALCPAGDSDSWKRMDDVYAAINKDSQCLFALGVFHMRSYVELLNFLSA